MNLLHEHKQKLQQVRQQVFSSLTDADLLIDSSRFSTLHYDLFSVLIKRNGSLLLQLQSSSEESFEIQSYLENIKWYLDHMYRIEMTDLNTSFQLANGNQYIQSGKRKISSIMTESSSSLKQSHHSIQSHRHSVMLNSDPLFDLAGRKSHLSIACGDILVANHVISNCVICKDENVEVKEADKDNRKISSMMSYSDKISTLMLSTKTLLNLLSSMSLSSENVTQHPLAATTAAVTLHLSLSMLKPSSSMTYIKQINKLDLIYLMELLKKIDGDVSRLSVRYSNRKRCIDLMIACSSSSSLP